MKAVWRPLTEGTRAEFDAFVDSLDIGDPPSSNLSEVLLRNFVDLTESSTSPHVHYIVVGSSYGGFTRKPANLILSWRKLFDASADVVVAAAGGAGSGSFIRGLIGLYVWNKVWRGMEEPITLAESSVIEALWCGRGGRKEVPEAEAFALVNDARIGERIAPLTDVEFREAVDKLVELHCIKLREGNLWLREWVRKKI